MTAFDALDVKIFREFAQDKSGITTQSDIRKPVSVMAKKLRVDEDTIRNRIERFHQSGFLRGWQVIVNWNLLGLKLAQLWLDVPLTSTMGEVIQKLNLVRGVFVIIQCYGQSLVIYLFHSDSKALSAGIETISRLSLAKSPLCVAVPIPHCEIEMKRTDWKIVECLLSEPRRPYNRIAAELGLSTRTIKRRIERMISGRAVFAIPRMNLEALEGVISTALLVQYEDGGAKAMVDSRIATRYDDGIVAADLTGESHSFFAIVMSNISKAEEILGWVRQQSGVKTARLDIMQRRIERYDWINDLIREKAEHV